MTVWQRRVLAGLSVSLLAMLLVPGLSLGNPDPCLMVYSDGPVVYHYESAEYFTVGVGDPLYDPLFDRGGEVLIDALTLEIAIEVYQAPGLTGFQLDEENQGYFLIGTDFTLVVDGFNNAPTTFVNILLVFDLIEPEFCVPNITVDGNPVLFDPDLGFYWPIGDLVVSTPTPDGNNFSDVRTFDIHWENCFGVRIWAFSDENFDLMWIDSECFSAFSHDLTVPSELRTWGLIKSLYSD